MGEKQMKITEVSKKYNISQDTLRYYEKVGMIPPVTRNSAGIRDYQEADCQWVELAKCMRAAGLSVEAMAFYVKLALEGDYTIPERMNILIEQKKILIEQQKQIQDNIDKLNYKISRYEVALETGNLTWK